jgi:hypothetical protein
MFIFKGKKDEEGLPGYYSMYVFHLFHLVGLLCHTSCDVTRASRRLPLCLRLKASTMTALLPTIKILNETHTTVKPLLSYLIDVLELDFFVPPANTDPLAYQLLFDNTLIATTKPPDVKSQNKQAPAGMSDVCIVLPLYYNLIHDLPCQAIKRAQSELFQASRPAYNILKLGYRLSRVSIFFRICKRWCKHICSREVLLKTLA